MSNVYAKIPAEAIDIADSKLNKTEYRVWLHLWKIDAYGDRLRVIPAPDQLAKTLNLHKRTITRACDKLEELGLFSFEIKQWQGINHYGSKSEQAKTKFTQKIQVVTEPDSGCCDSSVQNLTELSQIGQDDPNRDSAVQKMTERSNFGQDCQNQGAKVAPEADSNLSNNSLITINNSLINTGEEIQNEIQESDGTFGNFSEEEADRKFEQKEANVESVAATLKIVQESLNQNDLHKEDLKTEIKPKSENNVVDHPSAAAPKHFSNLREFVIYQAKQDPKINSPEIWADTVIRRNPDDWRAKWDAWEKQRSQASTYKPPEVAIDFEASNPTA